LAGIYNAGGSFMISDELWMEEALREAQRAAA